MTAPVFQVRLWGTRGSLPVTGQPFRKFGGNTLCIEMRCGENVILFDAGSGLAAAGAALKDEGRTSATLFFTHFHYDHVMGLPFFAPLWSRDARLKLWSGNRADVETRITTANMMAEYMRPPFFPVGPDCCLAHVETGEFTVGDVLEPYPGLIVRTGPLNHPGHATGYRVEWAGRSVAVISDTEHVPGTLDPSVMDLIRDCNLFLYDATFEDAELATFSGFGHSTWQQGLRLAQASGARQVGFVHHAKWRTDAQLLRIERAAQKQHAGAFCGRDMQVIDI